MASRIKLSGHEVRRLRNDLKACQDIKDDFERAKMAGVPNIVDLEEKLDQCVDRINKLLTLLGDE